MILKSAILSLVIILEGSFSITEFNLSTSSLPETKLSPSIINNSKNDCNSKYDFEKINALYLTNFEQKITQILTTIMGMDSNIKLLQEKAHVWDLYRHHIDAWDDHMKSLDHKIDLIKYKQDDTKSIEGKLTSIEFLINHILSKIVQMDDKTRNDFKYKIDNSLEDDFQEIMNYFKNEKSENKMILNRLNNILSLILNDEKLNRRSSNQMKNIRTPRTMQPIRSNNSNSGPIKEIERKLDSLIDIISTSDFKQFSANSRRTTEQLEDILEAINNVDEKTNRLHDVGSQQINKYFNICQETTNELSTFTESSDLLLKRIESLVLNVKEKIEQITVKDKYDKNSDTTSNYYQSSTYSSSEYDNDVTTYNSRNDEAKGYSEKINYSRNWYSNLYETSTDSNYNFGVTNDYPESGEEPIKKIVQPSKLGCHDLTVRVNGVYKFSGKTEINEAERDFYERYCAFPTNGSGWTVIQRRGPYDYQENFNRSWSEYREGFGSLAKDFWFGNEFIHRIVYNDSYELRIELEDFNDVQVWAEYSIFQIDSEIYNYNLLIGNYRGTVPDSMSYHNNQDFSTYDRRNDKTIDLCCSCAGGYGSGWWFDNCSEANLNGIYHKKPFGHNFVGIVWEHWHGDYSLRKTRMLIRPKSYEGYIATKVPADP